MGPGWTIACCVLSKIDDGGSPTDRPLEGTPVVTISKEADGWSVAIFLRRCTMHPLPTHRAGTGIDLGWSPSRRSQTGNASSLPVTIGKAETYLRRCQRRVARRQKGRHRRARRSSCSPKPTSISPSSGGTSITRKPRKLVKQSDVIYHEDLRAAQPGPEPLSRQEHQRCWGGAPFLAILTFKAANAGKRVLAVNPAFTSQRCSGPDCGVIVQKGLFGALA